jgi:hypothetical protein
MASLYDITPIFLLQVPQRTSSGLISHTKWLLSFINLHMKHHVIVNSWSELI